jgi:hypothetical protein
MVPLAQAAALMVLQLLTTKLVAPAHPLRCRKLMACCKTANQTSRCHQIQRSRREETAVKDWRLGVAGLVKMQPSKDRVFHCLVRCCCLVISRQPASAAEALPRHHRGHLQQQSH